MSDVVQPWLGLVGRTATWPQRLEAWSSQGSPPRVSYCPSAAHLDAQVQHGAAPVVLLDGDLSVVDRDLLADITGAGGTPIVIEGARRRLDWAALGAAAVLPADFDRAQLLALTTPVTPPARAGGSSAPVVAVTGPGGTGASVSAIAVAQGLAATHRRVLLADCCLHAEQAMLHNTHGSQPTLADLVDAHAGRTPDERQVRQLALGVVERGYYLLPGLPRARQWSRLREPSLRATLASLRTAFGVVVADVDGEVEGEAEGGSVEVEERNLLARTLLRDADVAVVVGQPTMKGVYALVRTVVDLLELGVQARRVLPVLNQVAPDQRIRADLSRAVRNLTEGVGAGGGIEPALFIPAAALEDLLRERDPLPEALTTVLGGAVSALLDRAVADPSPTVPRPVATGVIGHWSDGS